jgi:hypothetical protein
MGWATFWATFLQTQLVTLVLHQLWENFSSGKIFYKKRSSFQGCQMVSFQIKNPDLGKF